MTTTSSRERVRRQAAAWTAGRGDADWYAGARGFIREVAGGDSARAARVAHELSLWSPAVRADVALNSMLRAHHAMAAGVPHRPVASRERTRRFDEGRLPGRLPDLAAKSAALAACLGPGGVGGRG